MTADGELTHVLPGGARVLFSARRAGNMSSLSGERRELGRQARERLCARIGLDSMRRARQVHGARVILWDGAEDQAAAGALPEADGHLTSLADVGLMVLTADCLPVALGSPAAAAMLHAGWRGIAAGVLECGVRSLRELGAADEIVAVIGPGAGPCCYEVGPEVHAVLSGERRHGPIDLRAHARRRLLAAGVAEVRDVERCTICDQRYFSHRREGARAGRQAAVAWRS